MFSKHQLNAYKSIKAPQSLYDKIADHKTNETKKRKLPIIQIAGSLAACFAVIVAVCLFAFSSDRSPNIILNGQSLESKVTFYDITPISGKRTADVFSLPVQIDIKTKTEISVSHGSMTVNDNVAGKSTTLSKPCTVWWNIQRDDVIPECEMKISDKNGVTLITLQYDNAEKMITATKTIK